MTIALIVLRAAQRVVLEEKIRAASVKSMVDKRGLQSTSGPTVN